MKKDIEKKIDDACSKKNQQDSIDLIDVKKEIDSSVLDSKLKDETKKEVNLDLYFKKDE